MKVIKPSYEILTPLDGTEILRFIEKVGRVCYKSEGKITEDSHKGFVQMLINRGHEAMIEHAPTISVKFITDKGISHECVRHRLFSFAQECLSGDTEIIKGMTIKDLYLLYHNKNLLKKKNSILLKSCDIFNNIISNRMIGVYYKGKASVYLVSTSYGYKIKATSNHEFMTEDGTFKRLGELKIGDTIKVNGRPSLLKIDDEKLESMYIDDSKSPTAISVETGAPYRTVVRRLQQLGIFQSRLNDDNPEKYNKNHTLESYQKMKESILQGYRDGRQVWNKGLKEGDHPSITPQANALRENHHNNDTGINNSNWKGGISVKYYQRIMSEISECEVCGSCDNLEIHHIDRNRQNNDRDNLVKLCRECHNLCHDGWYIGTKAIDDKIETIQELGIEDVYDISMDFPYNNFVANGFIVHNSTRYVNYGGKDIEFILPNWFSEDASNMLLNETINMRWPISIDPFPEAAESYWYQSMISSEYFYHKLIEQKWSPQEARSVLPNSLKTEIVVSGNVREWRHFFKLRTAKSAHSQIREIAIPLIVELKDRVPIIFDDIQV